MTHHTHDKGYSVIEVLVGISILTFVGIAVVAFQEDVFSLNTMLSNGLNGQQEGRQAFKKMTAEIRSLSPSASGSYPINEAGTNSFAFYGDIDNDNVKERVRYFLSGATLRRGIIEPTGTTYNPANETTIDLVHDIANGATPLFTYYDANYDGSQVALTQPVTFSVIRLIKITVIIDKDPNRPPGPFTMTTQVSMRNLKDNL